MKELTLLDWREDRDYVKAAEAAEARLVDVRRRRAESERVIATAAERRAEAEEQYTDVLAREFVDEATPAEVKRAKAALDAIATEIVDARQQIAAADMAIARTMKTLEPIRNAAQDRARTCLHTAFIEELEGIADLLEQTEERRQRLAEVCRAASRQFAKDPGITTRSHAGLNDYANGNDDLQRLPYQIKNIKELIAGYRERLNLQ